MNHPDAYLLVVGIGIFLVLCSDIGTWLCGCFDSHITRIAYGPFQSKPPTRIYRAYTTSKIIMYMSSIIMYVIIYTAISPTDWSWMTVLHGAYYIFNVLWVPAVRTSVSRDIKWIAVVIVWMSTLCMLGILVLLWINDSHPKKSETDIRVAISACTLVFFPPPFLGLVCLVLLLRPTMDRRGHNAMHYASDEFHKYGHGQDKFCDSINNVLRLMNSDHHDGIRWARY